MKERIKRVRKFELLQDKELERYQQWKLYALFEKGYKPENLAEILHLPLQYMEQAYRKWLTIKTNFVRQGSV
jgi:hypothetical protein